MLKRGLLLGHLVLSDWQCFWLWPFVIILACLDRRRSQVIILVVNFKFTVIPPPSNLIEAYKCYLSETFHIKNVEQTMLATCRPHEIDCFVLEKKGPNDIPDSLILLPKFATRPRNHFCTPPFLKSWYLYGWHFKFILKLLQSYLHCLPAFVC